MNTREAMPLPPGPVLPQAAQTVLWLTRPIPFMNACALRYGDVFTARLSGAGAVVFLSDPGLIKQVFAAGPECAHGGQPNMFLSPAIGTRSVAILEGDEHVRRRRLLLPILRASLCERYGALVSEVASREVDRWPRSTPLALRPRMRGIAVQVILQVVLGASGAKRREDLAPLLETLLDRGYSGARFVRTTLAARHSGWTHLAPARFRSVVMRVDRMVRDEIAQRRRWPEGGEDVLSVLLAAGRVRGGAITDVDVRDELITLLVAGHETIATALTWCVELLLADPEAMKRMEQALTEDPLGGYPEAAIEETLRVRPVIPMVARVLQRPMRLDGYELPSGTVVAPCIYLLHRRADLYPEPDRFFPDRFLGARPQTYGWLPFGGGVRRCPGAGLALFEMREVMRTVLRQVRLSPVGAKPERVKRRGVTFAPAQDGMVTVQDRADARCYAATSGRGTRPRARAQSRSARAVHGVASSRE